MTRTPGVCIHRPERNLVWRGTWVSSWAAWTGDLFGYRAYLPLIIIRSRRILRIPAVVKTVLSYLREIPISLHIDLVSRVQPRGTFINYVVRIQTLSCMDCWRIQHARDVKLLEVPSFPQTSLNYKSDTSQRIEVLPRWLPRNPASFPSRSSRPTQ
jgi:hypothetical protein